MISLPGKMLSGPFARKLNFSMRLLNVRQKTAGASFKEKAFAHAADKIQPFYERGARKDEKSCKTKWAHVCISLSVLYLYPD
jgi:hypothetical protein